MDAANKLYKLIILYMLSRVDFPLTTSQISEFIVDREYTNFFKVNQALSELIEAGFVHEESTKTRTFYHLTEEGADTIQFFKNDISSSIREEIDAYFKQNKMELKNEISIKANYYPGLNGEYMVHCHVTENDSTLIELNIAVPSDSEAETITNNWSKQSNEIYSMIMEKLLNRRS